MAAKVRVSVKLDLDHELGHDHFQTWLSQLEIAFLLHGVTDKKAQYLAAAANLGEGAAYYLWQRYPSMPTDADPYDKIKHLFEEYFGGKRSVTSRLAALFAIQQQDDETVQAYRHRLQKEMRVCKLTTSAKLEDVLDTVAVHLFARGLHSVQTRQKVLETGETSTLEKAAETAQAVTLATQAVSEQSAVGIPAPVAFVAQRQAPLQQGLPASQLPASQCDYCGQQHPPGPRHCPAASAICGFCKKRGHYESVCRRKKSLGAGKGQPAKAGNSATCGWVQEDTLEAYSVQAKTTGFLLPLRSVLVNGHLQTMRVDTGSVVTVLPRSRLPPDTVLTNAPTQLQPVGKQRVTPLGVFAASLQHEGRVAEETVYVVDDATHPVPALLGERASIALGLIAFPVSHVTTEAPPTTELPPMKGPVTVHIKADAKPIQQTARRVPPALIPSLRAQIDTWLHQGVVEPVDEVKAEDFVSPLVAVPKPDKSIRWCVDLRQVNKSIVRPGIQLPTADELLAQLAGAKVFSKIDLKTGYSQLEIEPESTKFFVIASPLGYFRFKRLPFGVSSGPELFQQRMEQILAGISGIVIYLDDILIFSASAEEHEKRLDAVKAALNAHGITVNSDKSSYHQPSMAFLGHVVSAEGITPSPAKIEALCKMPDPTNVSQLRAFLGLSTYLSKFVPNIAATAKPLSDLLSGSWNWTPACAEAAATIRDHLSKSPILAIFDPQLPTRVEVDASGGGLGAVLTQKQPGDVWKPVYYASRKLSGPESRYAAIELEALAVCWAVNRFRSYLVGLEFIVLTDHKPLLQIFAPDYVLSNASIRVQRLVLRTQDLAFDVQYRPGRDNCMADALSRLPTEDPDSSFSLIHYVTLDEGEVPIARRKLAQLTTADPTLRAVRQALVSGQWPSTPAVAPYRGLSSELSVWPFPGSDDFLIYRGHRTVVPDAAVAEVLDLAHEGHPGEKRTKARIRENLWWPGWSTHVKARLAQCTPCLQQGQIAPVPLKPRELPPHQWHSLAVDIFYYQRRAFLSIMDVFSRYPAVVPLRSESTAAVIAGCRQVFTLFGTPARIISDNGPQFASQEFASTCREWNIQHERIVPYSPRQNPVERLHQTLKKHMTKSGLASADDALRYALEAVRSSVNTVTGRTPGDLLLRGGYNTPLRNLTAHKPRSESDVEEDDDDDDVRTADARAKATAKVHFDKAHRVQDRSPEQGQAVFVKEPSGDIVQATVQESNAHEATVTTDDGRQLRRHLDRVVSSPKNETQAADQAPIAATTTAESTASNTSSAATTAPVDTATTVRKSHRLAEKQKSRTSSQ